MYGIKLKQTFFRHIEFLLFFNGDFLVVLCAHKEDLHIDVPSSPGLSFSFAIISLDKF